LVVSCACAPPPVKVVPTTAPPKPTPKTIEACPEISDQEALERCSQILSSRRGCLFGFPVVHDGLSDTPFILLLSVQGCPYNFVHGVTHQDAGDQYGLSLSISS
jgi:hypothetical protein